MLNSSDMTTGLSDAPVCTDIAGSATTIWKYSYGDYKQVLSSFECLNKPIVHW
jgi:hypothetical protein